GRQFLERRVLTELQHADICNDGPAIAWFDLYGVVVHCAEAIADDVEEMTVRRFAKTVAVKRRRGTAKSTPDGHSLTAAGVVVAWSAEDVVSLAPTLKNICGDFEWKCRRKLSVHTAGVKMFIFVKEASSHDTNWKRPSGSMIGKEIALLQGFVPSLICHVLAA